MSEPILDVVVVAENRSHGIDWVAANFNGPTDVFRICTKPEHLYGLEIKGFFIAGCPEELLINLAATRIRTKGKSYD